MVDCPICMSTFEQPVCLPCGHLYCKECIIEHVNAPENESLTSNCPECRSAFPTTIPDLTYLPEKYHPFISNSLRRVYIDLKGDSSLIKKLKDTEDRLARKKRGEEALLQRCEALKASLDAHKSGEREAIEHAADLEEKIDDMEVDYENYINESKKEISGLKTENNNYRILNKSMAAKLQELKRQLELSERRRDELEQEMGVRNATDSDDSYHSCHSDRSWDSVRQRVIKPLPKRRTTRAREDDSVALSSSKRARVVVNAYAPARW